LTVRKSARPTLETLAPYLLEVPKPFVTPRAPSTEESAHPLPFFTGQKPLAWAEVFGNSWPVEVEVGFGKGLFLLNSSGERPDVNFLGVEKERTYTLFTAGRLAKRERTNVRLVSADAAWFLKEWVADQSVSAVHVYFPDPWWKKRHIKRRLLTPDFAAEVTRILEAGGRFHFATDVEAYFAEAVPTFQSLPSLSERPAPAANDARHDMDYLTNFERKFRMREKPIWRALFIKT
jgi:tRNA (guanine-N7-)-methyltransferase